MSVPIPSSSPAGWYQDPAQPGMRRYWDGQQWTEHLAVKTDTSNYALLAIIMAFVFAPLGIVFGVMGRKEIDRSGGTKTGRGLATAGMWVGIAACAFWVLYVLFFLVVLIAAPGNSN